MTAIRGVRRAGALTLIASIAFIPAVVSAQSHHPASIIYIVRDEKGAVLDPARLESIVTAKGEEMKPATTTIRTPDGSGMETVKCLESRRDIGGRPISLSEMTLKYGGKTMKLVFNVTVIEQNKRIDSMPFQEGTFRMETKWVKDDK